MATSNNRRSLTRSLRLAVIVDNATTMVCDLCHARDFDHAGACEMSVTLPTPQTRAPTNWEGLSAGPTDHTERTNEIPQGFPRWTASLLRSHIFLSHGFERQCQAALVVPDVGDRN